MEVLSIANEAYTRNEIVIEPDTEADMLPNIVSSAKTITATLNPAIA